MKDLIIRHSRILRKQCAKNVASTWYIGNQNSRFIRFVHRHIFAILKFVNAGLALHKSEAIMFVDMFVR